LVTMVVSTVVGSNRCTQRIINNQQRMESIFHTVDTIKSDLTKCGMRLQEAAATFGFPTFEYSTLGIKVLYGVGEEPLLEECWEGEREIIVHKNEFFAKRKDILIYDPERWCYEFNEIKTWDGDRLILAYDLQYGYSKDSPVIVLKQVEYKVYEDQRILKRKVNGGYFQPLIEEVTDFNIKYFSESVSVLYRIEINNKEQVRGYIFLTHLVNK
ncbi:MAG: hypothetical protein GY950_05820, partial [bacterium]|nr:hypothetical protein [bacterium]